MNPTQDMVEALRASIPNLKTQAQFTAFMSAFDALRFTLDAIYAGDEAREKQGLETLDKAFDVARKATDIGKKLEEVPPEHRGPASQQFTSPPAELQEYDLQKRLLFELEQITTLDDLSTWYERTKADRDKVVSQSLRNILLDEVRSKRAKLTQP